jgi:hypothetical protein
VVVSAAGVTRSEGTKIKSNKFFSKKDLPLLYQLALRLTHRRKAGGFAPSTPTGVPPASKALRGTNVLVPRSA